MIMPINHIQSTVTGARLRLTLVAAVILPFSLAATGITPVVAGTAGRHTVRSAAWTGPTELDDGPNAGANEYQGYSVALSADGRSALLGSFGNGVAELFKLSHDQWGPPTAFQHEFGANSVALSASGATAVIRQSNADTGHLYESAHGIWSAPIPLVVGPQDGGGVFNSEAALDASGSSAILGVPGLSVDGNPIAGGADVFSTVQPSVYPAELNFGTSAGSGDDAESVALSADGQTALLGAPSRVVNGHVYAGAVEVFSKVDGQWLPKQQLDLGSQAADDELLGLSVALSPDGKTALVGVPSREVGGHRTGAAEVFRRGKSGWMLQAQLDLGSGAVSGDKLGRSVALSGNGNIAIVGAPYRAVDGQGAAGAVEVFTYAGGHWSAASQLDLGTTAAPDDLLGISAALSADGHTILAGADGRKVDGAATAGAGYVWQSTASDVSVCCASAKKAPGKLPREKLSAKIKTGRHLLAHQTVSFIVGAAPHTVETCSAVTTKRGVASCIVPDGFNWSGRVPVTAYDYGNPTYHYGSASTSFMAQPAVASVIAVGAKAKSLAVYGLKPGSTRWARTFSTRRNTTISQPAVVNDGGSGFAVACQGPHDRLNVYEVLATASWKSDPVPGTGIAYSAPALTIADGKLWAFVEGPNNSLNLYWQTLGSTVLELSGSHRGDWNHVHRSRRNHDGGRTQPGRGRTQQHA